MKFIGGVNNTAQTKDKGKKDNGNKIKCAERDIFSVALESLPAALNLADTVLKASDAEKLVHEVYEKFVSAVSPSHVLTIYSSTSGRINEQTQICGRRRQWIVKNRRVESKNFTKATAFR